MTDVNWSEKPAEGGFIIAKKFIAIDCGSSGSVDDFGRDADLTRLPPLHAGGFGVFGDLHVVLKPPPANGCILIRRIQCSCKLLMQIAKRELPENCPIQTSRFPDTD